MPWSGWYILLKGGFVQGPKFIVWVQMAEHFMSLISPRCRSTCHCTKPIDHCLTSISSRGRFKNSRGNTAIRYKSLTPLPVAVPSAMDKMPQLDGGSALSLQKEILESRLGWTHQRTTKGDPEASNRNTLGDVTIDGDRVDDDSRGYRTTKRLLSRVALAFMGELPRFSDDTQYNISLRKGTHNRQIFHLFEAQNYTRDSLVRLRDEVKVQVHC